MKTMGGKELVILGMRGDVRGSPVQVAVEAEGLIGS
jgi:hypothetical protein